MGDVTKYWEATNEAHKRELAFRESVRRAQAQLIRTDRQLGKGDTCGIQAQVQTALAILEIALSR